MGAAKYVIGASTASVIEFLSALHNAAMVLKNDEASASLFLASSRQPKYCCNFGMTKKKNQCEMRNIFSLCVQAVPSNSAKFYCSKTTKEINATLNKNE